MQTLLTFVPGCVSVRRSCAGVRDACCRLLSDAYPLTRVYEPMKFDWLRAYRRLRMGLQHPQNKNKKKEGGLCRQMG